MAAWGVGSLIYNSGYRVYSNPYYVETTVVQEVPAVDYSQPLAEPLPEGEGQASVQDEAMALFDAARESFKGGAYPQALQQTNAALQKMPNDSVLHEFRALILFATKDYQQAAGGVYAVLSAGPGWDWTTLISLYPNVDVYTGQLRALEEYRNENPKSGDAHFLLAYHYLTSGYSENAAGEFKEVVKLVPQDTVSAKLLADLTGDEQPETPATPVEPAKTTPPDASGMVGSWKATRDDGSKFQLDLQQDGSFTWNFAGGGQTHKFGGKYTYQNGLLTLVPSDGGAMVGQLSAQGDSGFNFKLTGEPPGDPGLNFAK